MAYEVSLCLPLGEELDTSSNIVSMDISSIDSNFASVNRSWSILNWNIIGINSEDKCNAVREN